MKPILTLQAQAVEIVKKRLKQNAKELLCNAYDIQLEVKYINQDRYAIIRYYSPMKKMAVRYGVLFKKQRFHSFHKFFDNEVGEGETINVAHWLRYFSSCDKIVFVYQNSHNLEYKWISPLTIELLKEEGRFHVHTNKADSVNQIAFSTEFLKELK